MFFLFVFLTSSLNKPFFYLHTYTKLTKNRTLSCRQDVNLEVKHNLGLDILIFKVYLPHNCTRTQTQPYVMLRVLNFLVPSHVVFKVQRVSTSNILPRPRKPLQLEDRLHKTSSSSSNKDSQAKLPLLALMHRWLLHWFLMILPVLKPLLPRPRPSLPPPPPMCAARPKALHHSSRRPDGLVVYT